MVFEPHLFHSRPLARGPADCGSTAAGETTRTSASWDICGEGGCAALFTADPWRGSTAWVADGRGTGRGRWGWGMETEVEDGVYLAVSCYVFVVLCLFFLGWADAFCVYAAYKGG